VQIALKRGDAVLQAAQAAQHFLLSGQGGVGT
jgi:hypothetical protein